MRSGLIPFIKEYIKIIRVGRVVSMLTYPAFGLYLSKGIQGIISHSSTLIVAFVCIGLLMYTGIYALNKYFDVDEDRKTGLQNVTFQYISRNNVLIIALLHLTLGLLLTGAYLPSLLLIALALALVNIIYTIFLKKLNRIVAVAVIASTVTLKVLIGTVITQSFPALLTYFLITLYIISANTHLTKQINKGLIHEEDGIKFMQNILLVIAIVVTIIGTIIYRQPLLLLISVIGVVGVKMLRSQKFYEIFLKY